MVLISYTQYKQGQFDKQKKEIQDGIDFAKKQISEINYLIETLSLESKSKSKTEDEKTEIRTRIDSATMELNEYKDALTKLVEKLQKVKTEERNYDDDLREQHRIYNRVQQMEQNQYDNRQRALVQAYHNSWK